MCAINGLVDIAQKLDESEIQNALNRMNKKVIYRGPDDEGTFIFDHIGIGMRRLSIIDLEGGHQPIFNESKTVAVVCNGEIYNHKELRVLLTEKGHRFCSRSDIEVIVHAYEEYGTDCFTKFDGMFAIAIYDCAARKVILARDKAGEKPLYWYKSNAEFLFASELKSIMQMADVPKELSPEGMHQYFTLTYIPAPLTIFKHIYKLQAAGFMIVEANGDISCSSYWDMAYDDSQLINDYDTCKKMLREALFQAVESRLMSDVPLGAFMSGGIDSTLITGIATRILGKPMDTFTIGFESSEYDERDRAMVAARAFGAKMHIDVLTVERAQSIIDTIIENMDEPFADASAIPTYFVSELASDYVKVVLTGDGGDELFAGYSKYLIGYYSQKYNALPAFLTKGFFEPLIGRLPAQGTFYRKIRKVVDNAKRPVYEQRLRLMQLAGDEATYKTLMRPEFYVDYDNIAPVYLKYKGCTDEISQALYTDFKVVLEGDMFVKVDRMSMLNSIETRTPMMADHLLKVAARIPSRFKINSRNQKIILKDAFNDILPQELLNKPKMGFRIPLERWFREKMKSQLYEILNPSHAAFKEVLNFSAFRQRYEDHMNKRGVYTSLLWGLYVFMRWYQRLR